MGLIKKLFGKPIPAAVFRAAVDSIIEGSKDVPEEMDKRYILSESERETLNTTKPKKKESNLYNCHHELFSEKTEPVFIAEGVQYYRFKHEADMPFGRYKEVLAALHANSLKMDLPLLKAFLEEIKGHLSGNSGQISLAGIHKVIWKMESRMELQFEPMLAKRLATIVFFDETENLRDYSSDHGNTKIAIWEREGSYDFFSTMPMGELLGLKDFSKIALVDFTREIEDLLKDLTPEQVSQLSVITESLNPIN